MGGLHYNGERRGEEGRGKNLPKSAIHGAICHLSWVFQAIIIFTSCMCKIKAFSLRLQQISWKRCQIRNILFITSALMTTNVLEPLKVQNIFWQSKCNLTSLFSWCFLKNKLPYSWIERLINLLGASRSFRSYYRWLLRRLLKLSTRYSITRRQLITQFLVLGCQPGLPEFCQNMPRAWETERTPGVM